MDQRLVLHGPSTGTSTSVIPNTACKYSAPTALRNGDAHHEMRVCRALGARPVPKTSGRIIKCNQPVHPPQHRYCHLQLRARTNVMAPGYSNGGDRKHRQYFDKLMKDSSASFRAQDVPRFMAAMQEFVDIDNDPMDLLFRLMNHRERGARLVRTALSSDDSTTFAATSLVPFLNLLGSDALCRGACKAPLNELLGIIYQIPGLLGCLQRAVEAEVVKDAAPIAWFLLSVARTSEDARTDPAVRSLTDALKAQGAALVRELDIVLLGANAAAMTSTVGMDQSAANAGTVNSHADGMLAVEDLRLRVGGRHDNDHADFRSIKIMVTSEEALSHVQPFLPRQSDNHLDISPEAALLDRQFRLLREDMVGPLRQELRVLNLVPPAPNHVPGMMDETAAAQQQQLAAPLKSQAHLLQQMQRNVFRPVAVEGVEMKPRPCVMVSISLPMSHKAARMKSREEREGFWKEHGRGTLPLDALVCLACDGKPLVFATVVRRDPKELALTRPIIGLAFEPDQDGVLEVLAHMGGQELRNTSLIQVSASFFSAKPVLKTLQNMPSIPLSDELVHKAVPKPITYMDVADIEKEMAKLSTLDPSQHRAMLQAMEQRVALVQGPPGTGKTFLGVLLCDIIVRCTKEVILCVCYTNHALDQFLEALLEKGITSIVRIGGRSQSKRLEPYNMNELSKTSQSGRGPSSESRRYGVLKDESAGVEAQIQRILALLTAVNMRDEDWRAQQERRLDQARAQYSEEQQRRAKRTVWQQQQQQALSPPPQQSPPKPDLTRWDFMGPYLNTEHRAEWEQLCNNSDLAAGQSRRPSHKNWARWLQGAREPETPASLALAEAERKDKWEQAQSKKGKKDKKSGKAAQLPLKRKIGGDGKAAGKDGSGDSSAATASGSSTDAAQEVQLPLWQLSKPQRFELLRAWRDELHLQNCSVLCKQLDRANSIQLELRSLHDGAWEAVLAGARVIGCTTTGAAMYKDALARAKVGVTMVEEAGEILEAHILTSLSNSTKHLICIGDHKQLRPKVESYDLTVQSGRGHTLNVSLFERLVLEGYPHQSLQVQHRMRPEISNLIRHTYPALTDHPSVEQHPPVMGLATNVVFIDHREKELSEKEAGMWGAAGQTQSKVNEHEVGMCVAIVRYLFQQGYEQGQMVVLTPYLGQLLELQRALSADYSVLVDELDLRDLRKLALPSAWAGVTKESGKAGAERSVRVATIDNYQGEEADVVVVSLVRSNAAGSVGFLGEPERINVMLSRARHGLIMIGNSETLRNAKSTAARKHWGVVLEKLHSGGHIHTGLPAVCQQHKTVASPELDSPQAFAQQVPDGGCTRPCKQELPCGHLCLFRCHAFDKEHKYSRCKEVVHAYCTFKHLIVRECWNVETPCETCEKIRKVEEEEKVKLAALEREAAKKRMAAEVQKAKVEAHLKQLRQQQAAWEEDRAARLAQLELDLALKKAKKESELQERFGPAELAAREAEARQAAQQDMAEMEAMAVADAAVKAQEAKERELEALAKQEQFTLQESVNASERLLAKLDADTNRQLQKVENDKNRVLEDARRQEAHEQVSAGRRREVYKTAIQWKDAVGRAAARGALGLADLRQQLASAVATGLRDDTAGALDVAFGSISGLGEELLDYAVGQALAPQDNSMKPYLRALTLIGEQKWLDAYDVLRPLVDAESSTPVSPGPDLLALVQSKLGMVAKAPARLKVGGKKSKPASTQQPQQAQQQQQQQPGAGSTSNLLSHVAQALRLDHESVNPSTSGPPRSLQDQRQLVARAAGHALAVLLHPATPAAAPAALGTDVGTTAPMRVPAELLSQIMQLFQRDAAEMANPLQMPASAASSGAGAGGDAAVGASKLQRWRETAEGSKALKKMMELTGLDPIKQEMFDLHDQVVLDKERKRDLKKKQYNIRFYGNPGTGKTTVARLYASLLKELGVLPEADVMETSGAELVNGGLTKLKELLKGLEKGGVLFIDEAYQLNPKTNPMGAQVLDYLLPEMENKRGTLVVVLAGYQKPMEDLMGHNEGLPSRFPAVFNFPDYSDQELCSILEGYIDNDMPKFKFENALHLRIAARRLGRMRGTVGFGNARAARNLYEAAITRQSARVIRERQEGRKPGSMLLMRDDFLGPKHIDRSSSEALRELSAMRGLQSVKASVDALLQVISSNAEREEMEKPVQELVLNRVFLGNPGTGKTTVASIYGRVLHDLGLLSKGEVMVKNPSDFLGSVLGESEKKTNAILEASVGCVLVIDEAYGLYSGTKFSDPYKVAVIDTIVAKVQGVPGDDRCVLMLGYPEEMEEMMRNANPGLARRFQLQNAWTFEDYGDEDLLHILLAKAKRAYDWDLDFDVARAAVSVLSKERRKPNFGNAGAVNNLLATAALRMETRCKSMSAGERAATAVPVKEDFAPDEPGSADPKAIFKDLIGCQEVLDKLREYQATIQASQKLGQDPLKNIELNFLFTGSPGTGKTTVARRVGMLFKSLGLLASSDVLECSAKDFITGYVGQAPNKTREMFQRALGQVIFIDEAYRLNPKVGGSFMSEVLDEIVTIITDQQFANKMVVILAGYDAQIEELMSVNPGLKSRFSEKIHFADFRPEDACLLLNQQLVGMGLELSLEAAQALPGLMAKLIAQPGWSNGRDVGTWVKRIFRQYSLRISSVASTSENSVAVEDLQVSVDAFIASKKTAVPPPPSTLPPNFMLFPPVHQPPPQPQQNAPTPVMTAPAIVAARPQTAAADAEAANPPTIPTAADLARATEGAAEEVNLRRQLFGGPGGGFGGLSNDFLGAMQDTLIEMGYAMTEEEMQRLAGDSNLPGELAARLAAALPGLDTLTLIEMVRQWQQAQQQRLEEELAAKKRKQVPVWRCNICKRYGCPVAPYIESFIDIDE